MHSLAAVTNDRGFDRSHILTGFPTTLHLLRCRFRGTVGRGRRPRIMGLCGRGVKPGAPPDRIGSGEVAVSVEPARGGILVPIPGAVKPTDPVRSLRQGCPPTCPHILSPCAAPIKAV